MLSLGWLAFEAAGSRRRLSPVPAGWDLLSDADLAALCKRAVPVAIRHGRLVE